MSTAKTEAEKKAEKNRKKREAEKKKKAAAAAGGAVADSPAASTSAAASTSVAAGTTASTSATGTTGSKDSAKSKSGQKGGGAKKPSAMVQILKDRLAEAKRAEEKAKQEEEERLKKEAEEEAAAKEEEERKKAEDARKAAEKQAKKEKLRAEGKLLTKTEKDKERKRQQFLEQAGKAGLVLPPKSGDQAQQQKRPVYARKRPKKTDQKPAADEHPPPEAEAEQREEDAEKEEADATKEATKEAEPGDEDIGSWEDDNVDQKIEEKKQKEEEEKQRKEKERKEKEAKQKAKEEEKERKEREKNQKVAKDQAQNDVKSGEKGKKGKKQQELRSPICCILGHVDTGKTKLLDKIRSSNVQAGEAGGITQQIGATYFPIENVKKQTAVLRESKDVSSKPFDYAIPGLLVIDTPGHESFVNLRVRGSNLCDIAVLVVDIMHGLEQQTLESIGLLKERKTPFIIALNKIDRLYDWKTIPNGAFEQTFKDQKQDTRSEFEKRLSEIMLTLNQQGLNVALYNKNPDKRSYFSIVPTSAHTGEGIPDLLNLIVEVTQKMMASSLAYLSELQCTVLEVKAVEGRSYTIDVVLVNGVLHVGETIVVCGLNGPIVTTIRDLLTPKPMKELRVRCDYDSNTEVKAAMGVKIVAHDLEHAVAGTQLFVHEEDVTDLEELKEEVMQDLQTILSQVDKSGVGVYVQASTLGSLEALLSFLRDKKIPVSSMAIGPVHKKDVMKAATMLEHRVEYATILAFDVKITADAKKAAAEMKVQIFRADIIYHLFDQMVKYLEEIRKKERDASEQDAVFPVILDILPKHIYHLKDPILIGVKVLEGILKVGTPLCIPPDEGKQKETLVIGRVEGIEKNSEPVQSAKRGEEVSVKINQEEIGTHVLYGRHFSYPDQIYSWLSRKSIDLLKANFKDDLSTDDWKLVQRMKKTFNIPQA